VAHIPQISQAIADLGKPARIGGRARGGRGAGGPRGEAAVTHYKVVETFAREPGAAARPPRTRRPTLAGGAGGGDEPHGGFPRNLLLRTLERLAAQIGEDR
jgi:hypothetical protein